MKLREVQRILNDLFHQPLRYGQRRQLVFWYDPAGEFSDDVDDLQLDGVRLWKLTTHNLFATKYELEKRDPTSSFLIYAPMAKPAPARDWLYDQLQMGMEFSTDRTTAIMRELGVTGGALRRVFHRYDKFFNNKQRFAAFQAFRIETYDSAKVDIAVLAVLTHCSLNKLDEVVKSLLREAAAGSDRYRQDIAKFGDPSAFWQLVGKTYGYHRSERSLSDLILFFWITTLADSAPDLPLPSEWTDYVSKRPANVVVLMNQFMNQPQDQGAFRQLSATAATTLRLERHLTAWDVRQFLHADVFAAFDRALIRRLVDQLTAGVEQFADDLQMIAARRTLHWYADYHPAYAALRQAVRLFQLDAEHRQFIPEAPAYQLLQNYVHDYYRFDQAYRQFYTAYDHWQQDDSLIPLRRRVETIYRKHYLQELAVKWTQSCKRAGGRWPIASVPQQTNFYREHVQPFVNKGERIFVIVSDALRYEAGQSLAVRLNREKKGTAELAMMQSTLPSCTALGMPALLPHRLLGYRWGKNEAPAVMIDGMRTSGTDNRQTVLRQCVKASIAVRADDLRELRKEEMRQLVQSTKVVYIFHNRIDASGDHPASEAEVLTATTQAIDDLTGLVNKLVNNVSAGAIIITADHGYLYQRDLLQPSGKLPKVSGEALLVNRRYLLTEKATDADGTLCFSTVEELANDPPLHVTVPNGAERFMVQGAGANYVHGGAMPQEIAVPVITFRSDRHVVIRQVGVKLMSSLRKITNMITFLEFYQSEPVAEKVHSRRLKLYFIDADRVPITNENRLIADRTAAKPAERIFREKFVFKTKHYERKATYYLILEDEDQTVDKVYERIPFTIDIAWVDDFGF
ncbi:MAG: BREX-1 system phosphatase PglZ type A [Sporolactobacillus sp.]|jgi:uncharacterized protein (TIGR02687 family)|nr:BREX-1 system phosphatase PglZ type A [Sporolactobacillus sp.]